MTFVAQGLDCNPLDTVGCGIEAAVRAFARGVSESALTFMAEAMTWWTEAEHTSLLRSPAIGTMHSLLLYVGAVVLIGSVMWQGVQLMVRRKAEPLVNMGLGLVSWLVWSSIGTTVAVAIHEASIALSSIVLRGSIDRFVHRMRLALDLMPGGAVMVMLLSLVLWVLSAIQWVLGFFRIAGVVVLLGLLPTAAAGQLNESTKPWLRKVLTWCLSLLLYQALAAIVFSMGFVLMAEARGLSTVLVGIAVLALAVFCMPAMLRFFDWGGQKFSTGAGGGGGAMAAGAATTLLSGGALSQFMNRHGPGSDPTDEPDGAPIASTHRGTSLGEGSDGEYDVGGGISERSTGRGDGDRESSAQPAAEAGAEVAPTGASAGAGAAGAGTTAAGATPAGAVLAAGQVVREQAQRTTGAVSNAMTGETSSRGDRDE